ncbi:hypothetical protein CBR_g48307 [Chara braunii]|uniref:Glutaredoxin-like protein n=1 Tax=Chara braunii TaxID=69332 RepID=A0A388K4A5_CHABU|nr:hypothetical protein CBR_g48307 [Chara braunii]|eukprot:GBG64839.1 hypothetical protein CBR_g48307 [Chara braunii]
MSSSIAGTVRCVTLSASRTAELSHDIQSWTKHFLIGGGKATNTCNVVGIGALSVGIGVGTPRFSESHGECHRGMLTNGPLRPCKAKNNVTVKRKRWPCQSTEVLPGCACFALRRSCSSCVTSTLVRGSSSDPSSSMARATFPVLLRTPLADSGGSFVIRSGLEDRVDHKAAKVLHPLLFDRRLAFHSCRIRTTRHHGSSTRGSAIEQGPGMESRTKPGPATGPRTGDQGDRTPLKLVLYSKPGCCLCDGLKEKIHAAAAIAGVENPLMDMDLEVRDITTNPEWDRLYQYEIPVLKQVVDDGSEVLIPRFPPRIGVDRLQQKLVELLPRSGKAGE